MAISEEKMKIVIDNYFKTECNINTSIRKAFEKGFRIGVHKIQSAQPEIIRCKDCKHHHKDRYGCDYCDRIDYGYGWRDDDYCSYAERRTDE